MSVGVDGDVSAYSSDWASDSRDSRESASQHAMKPTWKSRRASGALSCATGAHARSAGDGLSRRSSTEKRRIHSAQSSCVSRTRDSHIRRSDACCTASFFGRATRHRRRPAVARRLDVDVPQQPRRIVGEGEVRRGEVALGELGGDAVADRARRLRVERTPARAGAASENAEQRDGGGRAVGVAARGAEELRREGGDGVVEGEAPTAGGSRRAACSRCASRPRRRRAAVRARAAGGRRRRRASARSPRRRRAQRGDTLRRRVAADDGGEHRHEGGGVRRERVAERQRELLEEGEDAEEERPVPRREDEEDEVRHPRHEVRAHRRDERGQLLHQLADQRRERRAAAAAAAGGGRGDRGAHRDERAAVERRRDADARRQRLELLLDRHAAAAAAAGRGTAALAALAVVAAARGARRRRASPPPPSPPPLGPAPPLARSVTALAVRGGGAGGGGARVEEDGEEGGHHFGEEGGALLAERHEDVHERSDQPVVVRREGRIPQDGEQRAERDRRQVQLGRRRQLVAPLVHLAAAAASRRRRPDERAAAAACRRRRRRRRHLARRRRRWLRRPTPRSSPRLCRWRRRAAAVDVGGSPSDAFATRLAARVMAARYTARARRDRRGCGRPSGASPRPPRSRAA